MHIKQKNEYNAKIKTRIYVKTAIGRSVLCLFPFLTLLIISPILNSIVFKVSLNFLKSLKYIKKQLVSFFSIFYVYQKRQKKNNIRTRKKNLPSFITIRSNFSFSHLQASFTSFSCFCFSCLSFLSNLDKTLKIY